MHGYKLNINSFEGERGAKLKQLGLIPIVGKNTVYIVGQTELDNLAKVLRVKSCILKPISDQEYQKLVSLKPEIASTKKVPKEKAEKGEPSQVVSGLDSTLYPTLDNLEATKVEPADLGVPSEGEPPSYPGSTDSLEMTESKQSDLYKVNFVAPNLRLSDASQTESTITAIRLADSLKAVSEAQLIYLTVTTAKRDDLFEVMTTQERVDLEQFIKFLRRNFGTYESALSATQLFDDAKQAESESDHTYLARLTNLYYRVKGQAKPDIIPDNEKNAIRNKFIKSLNRAEIRKHILNNLNRIPFEQLATEAQYSREALKVVGDDTPSNLPSSVSVMSIKAKRYSSSNDSDDSDNSDDSRRGRNQRRHRDKSRDRQFRDRRSYDRRDSRSNSRGRQVRFDFCERCGNSGHNKNQCWASHKTVQNYRKRLDSSHERRGRSRY